MRHVRDCSLAGGERAIVSRRRSFWKDASSPWEDFVRIFPFVDLVLFDYKVSDSEAHRTFTGVSNDIIRENLARIDETGIPIEIRIPVIPGINDEKGNIEESARFLSRFNGITGVVLLPYHSLGETKYQRFGREYRLAGLASPTRDRMEEIAGRLRGSGLPARVL